MAKYVIYLDDVRNIPDSWANGDAISEFDMVLVVRNLDQFKAALSRHGKPSHISFDFILKGFETGQMAVEHFLSYAEQEQWDLSDVTYDTHTDSSMGASIMEAMIEDSAPEMEKRTYA